MSRVICALFILLSGTASAGVPEALTASYAAEANGDYAGALAALAGVSAADDTGYVLSLRRGWLLYLKGAHADSVLAYQEASRVRPNAVEAQLGQTLPLMALRRWTEARTACEAVLTVAPGNYTALSRLAWVLYSQGRYAEALTRYETVVRQYPSDLEMRSGMAWTLLKLGRTVEARAMFQWVLQISPSYASATQGLAASGS
jgi:tetratricopeptide (TPR) repeat protein